MENLAKLAEERIEELERLQRAIRICKGHTSQAASYLGLDSVFYSERFRKLDPQKRTPKQYYEWWLEEKENS